jgi:hypothetical protein
LTRRELSFTRAEALNPTGINPTCGQFIPVGLMQAEGYVSFNLRLKSACIYRNNFGDLIIYRYGSQSAAVDAAEMAS